VPVVVVMVIGAVAVDRIGGARHGIYRRASPA
jgi:hypothetical protein